MWKPLTGEPYAGNPPVRFGGRGGESLSYPYHIEVVKTRLLSPFPYHLLQPQRISCRKSAVAIVEHGIGYFCFSVHEQVPVWIIVNAFLFRSTDALIQRVLRISISRGQ